MGVYEVLTLDCAPFLWSWVLIFYLCSQKPPWLRQHQSLYEWSWVLISMLAAQCGILGALGPAAVSFDIGNLSANYPALCSTVCWHSSFPTLQLIKLNPWLLTQRERWMIIKSKGVTSNQAICVYMCVCGFIRAPGLLIELWEWCCLCSQRVK